MTRITTPSSTLVRVLLRHQRLSSSQCRYRLHRQEKQSHAFHSDAHPTPSPFPPTENAILSAALAHVPQHGFSDTALTLGAKDAGYLDVSLQLFPRGVFELVNYYLVTQRLALKDKVQFPEEQDGKRLGVGKKVKILTMERLKMNEPIIHQWQDALAIMSLASNIPPSLSELHALSSTIWYLAGDTSLDTSWYTKRLSLAAIYASSETAMTQDKSPGFKDTEAFLNRRIDDATYLGSKISGVSSFVDFWAGSAVNIGRSWGMKV